MPTQTHPKDVIGRVPGWASAASLTVEELGGGKTNANYLVTGDGERFVLRLSGGNSADLGINRYTEKAATLAASGIGVAPTVVEFLLPEGHLVTRFIEGREWSPEEFKRPDVVRRVAETMRRVHALPAIEGVFDPYRDIEQRIATVRARGGPLPERLGQFLDRMRQVQAARAAALEGRLSLCHNDPWHNNFLDDGTVRLLDWEFAGMGDPFFDLASVAGGSSPEESAFLLQCYFGEVTEAARYALVEMLFVVTLWNATWALIQIGLTDMGHDYAEMAQQMFLFLEARL